MTPAELKSITRFDIPQSTLHNPKMIRLREIEDEKLREQVRAKIAEFREMMPGEIPDWWELDDADFSEILIELRAESEGRFSDDV